jgi:hypothetical protein
LPYIQHCSPAASTHTTRAYHLLTHITRTRIAHSHIAHSPHSFSHHHLLAQVGEPTVEATISILRGLKPRYEAHHGVRISDRALVAAAVLSGRYIRGRFLPDKAIDLVDEAAARTRVQLDSKPEVIDVLDRRKLQLEIESAALSKEKDEASKKRRKVRCCDGGGCGWVGGWVGG